MRSLRNRFLHVAVLALVVAGALIVGAMRPTQSSAQITIPGADQVNTYCIQDDRYPHNYMQFVAGPKINPDGTINRTIGWWAFYQCTGSGGALAGGTNPRVGQTKVNRYAAALDFWGQGTQPNGGVNISSYNRYDLYLADNNVSAYSLFRLSPSNMSFYPAPFGGFGSLFWPNTQMLVGLDSRIIADNANDPFILPGLGPRRAEVFFRPFPGGPVYYMSDSNIDDGGIGPFASTITASTTANYSTTDIPYPTTCKCP